MKTIRLALAGVLVLGLTVLGSAAIGSPVQARRAVAPAADGSWTQTKTITRDFVNGGENTTVDSRTVTVSVDRTRQLAGRERVAVSWSGAHPSGARASNPFGEGGLAQEYPVVILQCRGLDDPNLPAAQQLSPSTCWTSTRMQRSQSVSARNAVWTRDQYADPADRQQKSGIDPFPAEQCQDIGSFASHITPFVAAGGKTYVSCTADTMAPEAAVGAAFPPAEQAAFTDRSGKGRTMFEIRTAVENESLGCSSKVSCSLVVIPIMGISCADADRECRKTGRFEEGSSNFANEGVDASVSPLYWWAASNWRNRFSVPLSFALPPDACNVLDDRAPVGFYGSELLSQAALQWAPAYCLSKKRFKYQQNRMPDAAAFSLMEQGEAVAASVSGEHERSGTDPVGYAPTAITGFAVGYIVDKPDNAGEFTSLRLNARLLAKLLTQSYPASQLGKGHEGLADNPLSINLDPEFQKLNPGLDAIGREAAATVLSLSDSSDVIDTLTDYLAHDPDARAFVDGTPDPWGMKVNPTYRGFGIPVSEWPLKDTYVPQTEQECRRENPAPYLSQVAAPVVSLRKIAEAVLDAWPNVQTKCDRPSPSDPWKLGRIDRQGVGSRFMLGIVSLGDAARLGLRTAALETKAGVYVAPSDATLTGAIKLAKQQKKMSAFTIGQGAIRKRTDAYPGTMIVYTAARIRGMDKADAAKVAQFIRVSTTEGQRPGRGNGQLPEGYLPIRRSGPTKPFFETAERVAAAVEAQKVPRTKTPPPPPPPAGGEDTSAPPVAEVPDEAPAEAAGPVDAVTPVPEVVTAKTVAVSSPVAGFLLPLMLGLALAGAVVSAVSRIVLRARGVR